MDGFYIGTVIYIYIYMDGFYIGTYREEKLSRMKKENK